MERKAAADQTNRVYEKFEPSVEWVSEAKFDTLVVPLPGFTKEELKVQVTSSNKLRISGARPLDNNKWSSFRKELPIPSKYDANEISGKFEGGKLLIKLPNKIIKPADHQQEEKPQAQAKAVAAEASEPQNLESEHSQAQKRVQDQQAKPPRAGINGPDKSGTGDPSKTSVEKQASRKANDNGEVKAALVEPKTAAAEDLAGVGRRSTSDHANAVMEKDKKFHDSAAAASAEAGKEVAGSSNSNDQRDDKFKTKDLKEDNIGGLVMELKQLRNFRNIGLAVVLVLVACIFAKSAIIGKTKD